MAIVPAYNVLPIAKNATSRIMKLSARHVQNPISLTQIQPFKIRIVLILVLKATNQIHQIDSVYNAVCDSVLIAVMRPRFLVLNALMVTNMISQVNSVLKIALVNSSIP